MKQVKKFKSIFAVGGLVALLSASFFLGGMIMTDRTEANATALTLQKLESRSDKDIVAESDSFIQTSREFAQELLREHADLPLLDENAEEHWGNSSLENIINDVNAGNGAKQAILTVCEENHIDAATARIGDLTEEQIIVIDQEVFCNSDHPIGE